MYCCCYHQSGQEGANLWCALLWGTSGGQDIDSNPRRGGVGWPDFFSYFLSLCVGQYNDLLGMEFIMQKTFSVVISLTSNVIVVDGLKNIPSGSRFMQIGD